MTATFESRFWAKVERSDGCWRWTAARYRRGYGCFALTRTRNLRAHRVAWELTRGPIRQGMEVLHECDTPHARKRQIHGATTEQRP
jgi:hypothetical protein